MTHLADQHCEPRRGAEHKLSSHALRDALAALPGWELADDGGAIRKTFKFADYYRTLAFVNALAYVAHREDHHPDLGVHYNRCVVTFSTHDVGGVSQNDLICAAKTDRLGTDAPA